MQKKLYAILFHIFLFSVVLLQAQETKSVDDQIVRFKVYPKSLPPSSKITIVGNHPKLGNWDASKTVLTENPDKSWSIDLQFSRGTRLAYKITRGSWETEAMRKDLSLPPNSVLTVKRDTTIIIEIEKWKDEIDKSFRIAHLQIHAKEDDISANLVKAENYCRLADSLGADLALLPERYSVGYGPLDPGKTDKWYKNAIHQDDSFIQHFISLAVELDMAIAVTFFEIEEQNYYNTVTVIDRFGKLCLTYRKVHLFELGNDAICTPGDAFYVCDLDTRNGIVKLGALICADYYYPESARILALKGAEIVIVPNAAPLNLQFLSMLKARAIENCMGFALTNYPYRELGGDFKFTGLSTAYNPWYWGDNTIFMADGKEGVYMSEFDLLSIRQQREVTWFGNAFRHPGMYKALLDTVVNAPFKGRKTAIGQDFTREKRINTIKH